MVELFRRAAAHGARVAFRAPAGETSYATLLARSASIAQALLAGRADLAEERIAFMLPAGADYALAQWGIWRAGGIALALNAAAAPEELEHMLRTAGIRRVIVRAEAGAALAATCAALGVRCERLDALQGATDGALPALGPERRAMIVFTSGTTSKPKGVVSTHGVIEAQIRTLVESLGVAGRRLHPAVPADAPRARHHQRDELRVVERGLCRALRRLSPRRGARARGGGGLQRVHGCAHRLREADPGAGADGCGAARSSCAPLSAACA
jgi:long-subunit acyl-CoA synthetase (AMP-forming)